MDRSTRIRTALTWTAGALGLAAGAYASYVAVTWLRYGHPTRASDDEVDPLLDRFMPTYDVVERHHVHVAAPADITLAVAREADLQGSSKTLKPLSASSLAAGRTQTMRQ